MKKEQSETGLETLPNDADSSRRDFLRKAGKLAIYTPPAMITLMQPGYNAFATSGGCPDGNAAICGPIDINPE